MKTAGWIAFSRQGAKFWQKWYSHPNHLLTPRPQANTGNVPITDGQQGILVQSTISFTIN
jgi:hypothetical protein